MICLNAVVGMCAEWHSDDGANTSSMSKEHAAPLSSPVLPAQPRISLQRPGSVKLHLSTAGKGRRQAPCPDANRYGVTHAEAQGGPQSEVGAWGREPIWGKA